MAYPVGSEDFSLEIDRLAEATPQAIIHWGNAGDGAKILQQLRERGLDQPFFCSDRCASEEFVALAGDLAQEVYSTYPWNPDRQDPALDRFRQEFEQRYGVEPDTYAAHAYDGMNLLVWAIQHAGLNRAKIRDLLAYRSEPWPGVTGKIPLNAVLDDAGEVFLARWDGEKWRYYSRQDLDIPSGHIAPDPRQQRDPVTASTPGGGTR
jgi:ABC-type branched-subunit amino acid transport system substrate-binding protein